MTIWMPSHKGDRPAVALADRHYNRQKIGSPQFMPPGRTCVLLATNHKAVMGLSWPFAEHVKHAWPGAWVNSIFRNEKSGWLASDMIVEALGIARLKWEVPAEGCITFVNPKKVRGVHRRGELIKGFCFMMAGFRPVGETSKGLIAWHMTAAQIRALPPVGLVTP